MRQAQTDGTGRFELRRLGEGVYRVEASLIGYAPAVGEVSCDCPAHVAGVELSLARRR
jgi:hypothetical protein